MALKPLNLFVSHDGKSKRQHITCRYKCGDACWKPVPNTSDNEYFGDIVKAMTGGVTEAEVRALIESDGDGSYPALQWSADGRTLDQRFHELTAV